jgi:phage tail sheath protein FI
MLQLRYPGIYTQELSSGVRTISGAPTSVALFVGPTKAGIDGRPTRVLNFGDFERSFGGLSQTSSLSYSVLHFFANGGGEAFVIRVPANGAVAAETLFKSDGSANESLRATALGAGLAGNEIFLEFDPFGINAHPYSTAPAHDKKLFNLTITDRLTGRSERFGNVTTSSSDARFASTVVNDQATGSKLVKLTVNATSGIGAASPQANGTVYKLGTLPAGPKFTSTINLLLSVSVLAADGSAAAALFATPLPVTVFATGTPVPVSVLEMSIKLVAAINAAIRADATAAALMEGVEIEGALFEGGTLLRLRTAPPGAGTPVRRLSDATVTIADPAAPLPAGTAGFLATFFSTATPAVSNPSRYRLGAPYLAAGQVIVVAAPVAPATTPAATPVAGLDGDPNGQPNSNAFKQAVMDLEGPDPFFNILCLPDLVRPSPTDPNALQHANAPSVYAEAARICKKKFAFLLIDPPPNVTSVGAAESWKTVGFTFQSNTSAAYFPNIRVDDPLMPGSIKSHPPSGAVAGVFARTDGQVGVWQAPAGTTASLSGAYGPSVLLSDDEHGLLNPIGLNCIRQFPTFGTVVFGSRTVDGSNAMASEYKYVPVSRTRNYILRTLSEALRWAVHQPNGEQLWSQLRMNVNAFMQGLFRAGAFKGVMSRDAYFVACDATTTTADDINQGIVNIVIGFAPLKPAEFVVISLRQIVQPAV